MGFHESSFMYHYTGITQSHVSGDFVMVLNTSSLVLLEVYCGTDYTLTPFLKVICYCGLVWLTSHSPEKGKWKCNLKISKENPFPRILALLMSVFWKQTPAVTVIPSFQAPSANTRLTWQSSVCCLTPLCLFTSQINQTRLHLVNYS